MNYAKPVKLTVQGLGHVPSFKNHKRIITRPNPRLMTRPEVQEWMDKAAASIESQLISLYQIAEAVTPTGQSLQSWIQSSMPLDDDLVWIGVPSGNWRRVKPGEEGFEIIIEEI